MNESRRKFLKKAGCTMGAVTLASQMHHLGVMSTLANAVGEESVTGYKALVLIFLAGGNDGNNMIVPKHETDNDAVSGYGTYAGHRPGLAIAKPSLLDIEGDRMPGLLYGMHPALGPLPVPIPDSNDGIHGLWDMGKIAAVTNVGTLVLPTTKAQYGQASHPKPYQLFSHSDQIEINQSGRADLRIFTGWGGRVADKMFPPMVPEPSLAMLTSIAGAQLFSVGRKTVPLAVADSATPLNNLFHIDDLELQERTAVFNALLGIDDGQKYIKGASKITKTAVDANIHFQNSPAVTAAFPDTGIGRQLKQVAKLISLAKAFPTELNIKRQIFFCQLGGFDTHAYQPGTQSALLTQLSQAMRAFYNWSAGATWENEITTFTMSDFSRTLSPTGTGASIGTDHAWASHQLVMGGSVYGGNFYGFNTTEDGYPFPLLIPEGPHDTDTRGRWIPTTATEQYTAQLARWFGLPQDTPTLEEVFPNLDNFPSGRRMLNFIAAP